MTKITRCGVWPPKNPISWTFFQVSQYLLNLLNSLSQNHPFNPINPLTKEVNPNEEHVHVHSTQRREP